MLDVIIRKTYGFNKKSDKIATLQFIEATGLTRRAVIRARENLKSMGIITITNNGYTPHLSYGIQKDYSKWKVLPKKVTVTNNGHRCNHIWRKSVTKKVSHKRNKETIQKKVWEKPSLDEIISYCKERNNKIDPQYFLDYQDAREWKLKGGQKIKDWRAVIRTWERNDFNKGDSNGNQKAGFNAGKRSGAGFIRPEREAINEDACADAEEIARQYEANKASADGADRKKAT